MIDLSLHASAGCEADGLSGLGAVAGAQNDEEIDQLMTAAAPFKDATGRIQYSAFAKTMLS